MFIECTYCNATVDAKLIAFDEGFPDYVDVPIKISFMKCPICKLSILGYQEAIGEEKDKFVWSNTTRVWPDAERIIDPNVPVLVRHALEEARLCYKAGAYSACAVMCGKVLEGICKQYNTETPVLAGGLKELLDKQIIDKRIYEWGEELRIHRNIGAHATGEKISIEDANDLFEFASAICNYVFVLSKKFEEFKDRKSKNQNSSDSAPSEKYKEFDVE